MISRIEGDLRGVEEGAVELACGSLTYTLMVPAADVERLAGLVGDRVGFHTLQYLESHGQGSSFLPRLLGFASAEQRAFFELLTTVKGLGMRKALRAMRLPYQSVLCQELRPWRDFPISFGSQVQWQRIRRACIRA